MINYAHEINLKRDFSGDGKMHGSFFIGAYWVFVVSYDRQGGPWVFY